MSSRWLGPIVVAAAIVVVGGVVGVSLAGTSTTSSGSTSGTAATPPPTAASSTTTTTTTVPKPKKSPAKVTVAPAAPLPKTGWVATLHRTIAYYAKPGGAAIGHVSAKDPYGQVNVLGIVGAPRTDGWAEAELPIRPDGSTAWIRTSAVNLSRTPWWIKVDLSTREITVGDGSRTVLTSSVAVGSPSTPTPTAQTYVWESLKPSDPTGPYGPYILGLALYSKVLATFGDGGPAQIAIHGTDEPGSIGEDVSNGCVHVPNALVTRLVKIIPLGTPVTIVA